MDSDAGVSKAAPTACATRAATSQPTPPARPQAADAARNRATPVRNMRLPGVGQPAGRDQHGGIDHGVAVQHHDMSAAEAWGKPARAPKAAYSKVASSDTRKTATLAIQKTGQGDPRIPPKTARA